MSLGWERREWGKPEEEGERGRSREEVEDEKEVEDDEAFLKRLQLHFNALGQVMWRGRTQEERRGGGGEINTNCVFSISFG